jgi:GAF domain-containing protein
LGEKALPAVRQAITQRDVTVLPVDEEDEVNISFAAPIMQRGVVIGALGIQADTDREWTEDEIALVEAVIERIGLTAETLRLLDETQRRAAREQAIGEVTARIRETLDMETMLRTATGEIRQTLNLGDLVIRLLPPKADDQGK